MVKIPLPIGPKARAIKIVDSEVKTAERKRVEKVKAIFLKKEDIKNNFNFILFYLLLYLPIQLSYHKDKVTKFQILKEWFFFLEKCSFKSLFI